MSSYLLITAFLGYEYFALSFRPELSFLNYLQKIHLVSEAIHWTTQPGRTLSLWVGWFGLSLMLLMNVYTLRKKLGFMQNWGKISSWLNFHIFCGLMGPTLIFFHCSLKVRGIVGVSFWSMIVSLSSGIIGRYFLGQISSKKNDYEELATKAIVRLDYMIAKINLKVDAVSKSRLMDYSLSFVGGHPGDGSINPVGALFSSLIGDLKVMFSGLPTPADWPLATKEPLLDYAMNKRRAQFLDPFNKLMGYWHTFHFPFAIFMYIAAVIHVISSLIFLKA